MGTSMNQIDPRLSIGGNKPPGQIEFAREAYRELAKFLAETPVITTADEAKVGGAFAERTKIKLAEMEDERKSLVRPLNDEVDTINDRYRVPRHSLTRIFDELKVRLTAFAKAEEDKRLQEAEAKRKAAEEAERIAREAERLEAEAKENASVGELGVDVGAAIEQADTTFADFGKASREAARAERDVPVRIASSFGGRALSMRTREVLTVNDPAAAIKDIGLTDKIRDAIITAARDYRKVLGSLPKGVTSTTERSL